MPDTSMIPHVCEGAEGRTDLLRRKIDWRSEMTTKPLVGSLEIAVQQARILDAQLSDRLAVIADAVRALNPTYSEAVDRMVARFRRGRR